MWPCLIVQVVGEANGREDSEAVIEHLTKALEKSFETVRQSISRYS